MKKSESEREYERIRQQARRMMGTSEANTGNRRGAELYYNLVATHGPGRWI